jgi:hypothetical protein
MNNEKKHFEAKSSPTFGSGYAAMSCMRWFLISICKLGGKSAIADAMVSENSSAKYRLPLFT